MRGMVNIVAAIFLLLAPMQMLAKGKITRITIKGGDLKAPAEITDVKTIARFQVWQGPGTSSDAPGFNPNVPGFIIDWSSLVQVGDAPKTLQRYEVSFWAEMPKERLIYVVFYAYDPAAKRGYVYLPGKTEKWYELNVSTIFRNVEGRWFHSWSAWDDVAISLIAGNRHSVAEPQPNPF